MQHGTYLSVKRIKIIWLVKKAIKIKRQEEDAGSGGDRPASNIAAGWDRPLEPGNGLQHFLTFELEGLWEWRL